MIDNIGSGNEDMTKVHLGLERMYRLMEQLGNPQERIPLVHVAGTNGKGATVAFLRSICTAAGIRTGSFQSPAVFDPREAICVDGQPILDSEHESLCSLLQKTVETIQEQDGNPDFAPSGFELQTAEAFCYFEDKNVDLVILETGLGGDGDATNCYSEKAQQLCSIITPVGLDHCDFLGNTLEEIAGHKAGIMRPGCPVVLGLQSPEAERVFLQKALELHCSVITVDENAFSLKGPQTTNQRNPWNLEDKAYKGQTFDYRNWKQLLCGLPGLFQRENAACALEAAWNVLRPAGFGITEEAIRKGLADVCWPGRFELIPFDIDQWLVLDGAHNFTAAYQLCQSLQHYFSDVQKLFICGVLQDKDYRGMIQQLSPLLHESEIIAVTPTGKRGLSAAVLCRYLQDVGYQASVAESVEEAAGRAEAWLRQREKTAAAVVAFGSLSWLGAFRQCCMNMVASNISQQPWKD